MRPARLGRPWAARAEALRRGVGFAVFAAFATVPASAGALDKQGSAHGGGVEEGDNDGFNVAGALTYGVSLYNPSYAARPDNTGRTLFRYAAHVDVDLLGRKLSVPLDLNLFTDRRRGGIAALVPSELDLIGGLTSTWNAGPGAVEFGARVEHDRQLSAATDPERAAAESEGIAPCGRGGLCSQTYVDVRARYLYSLAQAVPRLGPALGDGDVSGWVTLGYFAVNPSYAARPDNTGLALFRYAVHTELSVWHDYLSVGVDATMFTDRRDHPLRPSELDLTPEIIGHLPPFELHVAYERDLPLDRGGLTQSFLYALGVWNFDLKPAPPRPLEHRGQVLSP